MKIKLTVEVDISFDLESDGVVYNEGAVDGHAVGKAIAGVINTDIVTESMVDAITEDTGWCVTGMTITTEAEQVG